MPILDMLADDHRAVLDCFDRVATEEGSTAEERMKLYAEGRTMILAHSKAEEETVYILLAQKGDRAQAQVLEQENDHALVESLIGDLDQAAFASEQWEDLFTQLVTAVEDHIETEETEMFPMVREMLPDTDAIGEEFASRKEEVIHQLHPATR